ncbi:MAG: metalloregulator ArsR/SmtB family transcription factor [Bacteroidota bacterium]
MALIKRNIPISSLERMAEVLKTIAHPVRLDILELLEVEKALTVSDIQEKLGQEVATSMLSHHLIKMKDKGILTSEKKGKYIFYQIKDRHILQIFDCMQSSKLI